MREDPPFAVLLRDGFDASTAAHLERILELDVAAPFAAHTGGPRPAIHGLMGAFDTLSDPTKAFSHGDIDLEAVLARCRKDRDPSGAVARAVVGLLVVASLEGLAKKYKPEAMFPYLSVNMIRTMCLPVARLLVAADAYRGAATLSALVRHYVMCDVPQRTSKEGRIAIAESRAIETEWAMHVREQARYAAWSLYDGFAEDPMRKACVAGLFFAVGDVLRARAIAYGHVPSLSALVDLVETSLELAPVDPLLQAVWLLTLGETRADVSETVRFALRAVHPEVNGAFKGVDEGAKETHGLSISAAYAFAVVTYFAGAWLDNMENHRWWQVLVQALESPIFAYHYRSGLLRLVEVYNLALLPGDPVPLSEFIAAMSGTEGARSDIREVAALLLRLDAWTVQRDQVGRSLAYDSAFIMEPWRRAESEPEPLERSIELLEAHRRAGLQYWLSVVPPLTVRAEQDRQREAVAEDKKLMTEYRSLAFLATMMEAPLYVRVYGEPIGKFLLPANEDVRLQRLNDYDSRRREWFYRVSSFWPEYADARVTPPVTLDDLGAMLGIG
jgi:hypothetical protein